MQQAKARVNTTGAVLMGAGGLVALIGSVLAWAKVTTTRPLLAAAGLNQTFAGTSSGDGKAVLVMGIIAVAAAVVLFVAPRRGLVTAMGIVAIVAGLIVAGVTIRDVGQKNRQIREGIESATGRTLNDAQVKALLDQLGISISLAAGIYISMLGGLAVLGGGIVTTATASQTVSGSSSPPSFDAGMVSSSPMYGTPPPAAPPMTPPPSPEPPSPAPPDPGTAPA